MGMVSGILGTSVAVDVEVVAVWEVAMWSGGVGESGRATGVESCFGGDESCFF